MSPRQRGAVAFDDGQQLGFAAELAEDDLERLARLAPGDELLVDEADRVAAAEAALGVVARGLGDAAGAHALDASPPSRRRWCARRCVASSATAAARPDAIERVGTTRTTFSESSAARSAAMRTLGEFGSTTTSSAGTSWMPASSS